MNDSDPKPDLDERFKIEGDPEDALRAVLGAERWYIVNRETDELASPPNPKDGFATESEARDFHRTVREGDPALEIRRARGLPRD
jgi:hypothetical protein